MSENIIEASWEALVDSLEYAFPRARTAPPADPVEMSDEPLSLAKPIIGAEEELLVLEVLRSGHLSLGPDGPALRRGVRGLARRRRRGPANSGTTALHLGVRAHGWGPGDEVVLTPFTFVASGNCLLYEGAKPVFADIDPVTLNLDPATAEAAIGENTAGILPIDIFGYPADMARIRAARRGYRTRPARGLGPGARRDRRGGTEGRQPAGTWRSSRSTRTSR